MITLMVVLFRSMTELEQGRSLGCHADPRLRLHVFELAWFSLHDYGVVDIHSLIDSS